MSCIVYASRNAARLSAEELAAKRDRIRRANVPTADPSLEGEIDSLRGLTMPRPDGAIYYKDGTRLVPPQPARLRFPVTAAENLLVGLPEARWTGPFNLRETFVVSAWHSSLYGGWNFSAQRAINAWSYYGKPGPAARSEGEDLDAALATTAFGSSDGLADSGVLKEGVVYFLEVTTSAGSRVAARQDFAEAHLIHAVDQESGEPVPAEIEGLARPVHAGPFPADQVAEIILALEPPFGAGIGAFYVDPATGERAEFVNALYYSLAAAVYTPGVSLTTLWMNATPEMRAALVAIFPEQAHRMSAVDDDQALLAQWVADFRGGNYPASRFGARAPSKQLLDLAARFPAGVASEAVAASLKRGPPSGVRRMLKTIRHWVRIEMDAE